MLKMILELISNAFGSLIGAAVSWLIKIFFGGGS